jgi:hypothetical protein
MAALHLNIPQRAQLLQLGFQQLKSSPAITAPINALGGFHMGKEPADGYAQPPQGFTVALASEFFKPLGVNFPSRAQSFLKEGLFHDPAARHATM